MTNISFFKQPIKTVVDFLSQIVSIYEIVLLVLIFPCIIISTQNVFLILLWLGIMSKYIPELACQYFFTIQNKTGYWFKKQNAQIFAWAQRPSNATKCGLFPVQYSSVPTSVFPSGHVFTMSVMAFYMLFKFTNFFSKVPNSKQITFIVLLMLFVVMIANIQTKVHCQTTPQVVAGALFGSIWAILVYFAIEEIVKQSARIQSDEIKFLALFSNDA
jgi:membrane-associated phospholipid phosphatase